MFSINEQGVEVYFDRSSRTYQAPVPRKVFLCDWDATVAHEKPVHDLEEQEYPRFFAERELPSLAEFLPPGSEPCDILFRPIAAWHHANLQGQAPCPRSKITEQIILPYLRKLKEVESIVTAHDGAASAMEELRRQNPDSFACIVTQCPWPLGIGRMITTGMTKYFDGIVGVRTERPKFLREYFEEVITIEKFLQEELAPYHLFNNFTIVAGVPDAKVKPDTLHGDVVLRASNVGPGGMIFGLDDKPRRMAPLIARYRNLMPSFYLQAQVSTWEEAKLEHYVSGVFTSMSEIPGLVSNISTMVRAA